MDKAWENETRSATPTGSPVLVWLEEVARAAGKSLIVSAVARCVLGASSGGPSSGVVIVSIVLLLAAARLADFMPVWSKPAEEKIYPSFKSFWPRYLAEHREPRDRVAHVFEFFGVAAFMAVNPGRLVAFCLTLSLGSLITRPLLHWPQPRIESQLMYLIGGIVSHIYGVPITFAFGYGVWLAFDFLGHAYIGENAKAAAFLGRHYLAWALVGQAHFACQVLAHFPREVSTARRCVAARATAAHAG